jgi:cytochrome c556
MKKTLKWSVCGILVIALCTMAYAQFAKPEDAIEYRQADMVLIAHHFGLIAAAVQGKKPFDPVGVALNATLLNTLSKLPWEAFMTPGSEKGKTHLNASAFTKDIMGFRADADAFVDQTIKLSKVSARGGDRDAIKAQVGAVGKSCKTCHDHFRSH